MVHHRLAGALGILGANGGDDGGMMAVQQAVILLGKIDRPPDAALKLLHRVKNGLHQVEPDDVVGGPGNDNMQIGVEVLGGELSRQIFLHA